MSSPCPRLRDLDSALSSLSWGEVKRMAIHLHHSLTLPALDKIGEDRSTAGERCLYCMKEWLDGDIDACWAKVVTALREIGKNQLAKELQSRYCAGCPVNRPTHTSTYSEPRTRPLALHVSPVLGTASNPEDIPSPSVDVFTCKFTSDLDELERVVKGFLNLEEQFVSLVTHVQFYFSERESESPKFLRMFCLTLTNLPMSRKFQNMHFLKEKKALIRAAPDVDEIFDILSPYWNHVDYSLLEHITMEFGSREMKMKVKVYVSSLTQFEKETTIQIFVDATCDDRKIPPEFNEVIIKLDRRPSECTLYDIRKFKESLACKSSLNAYCVQLKRVGVGSVVMVLAVHRDVVDMFVKTAEDFQFKIGSNILSVERVATAVESESVASVLQKSAMAKPSGSDAHYVKLSDDHLSYQEMFHSSETPELQCQMGIPYGSRLHSPSSGWRTSNLDSDEEISEPPSPNVSSDEDEIEKKPLRNIADLINANHPDQLEDKDTVQLKLARVVIPTSPNVSSDEDEIEKKPLRNIANLINANPPDQLEGDETSQISSSGIPNLFESPMCVPDHLPLERDSHDATTAESPGTTVQPQSRLAELKNQIMMRSSGSKLSLLSADSGFSSSYSLSSYLSSSTLSIFSNVSYDSQSSVHHTGNFSERSNQLPKYGQPSAPPQSLAPPEPEVLTPGERETDIIDKILLEAVGCLMHQENCRIPKCPCKQVKKRFQHILPQTREHMQEEADKIISLTTPSVASIAPGPPVVHKNSLSAKNLPILYLNDSPMAEVDENIYPHYHMTSRSHIRQSRGSQQVIQRHRSKSMDLTPVIEQPECREALHGMSPTTPSAASIAPPVLLRDISLSADNLPSLCLNDCPMAATPQLEEIPDHHKDSPSSDETSSHSSRISHLSAVSAASHISHGSDGSITTQTLC